MYSNGYGLEATISFLRIINEKQIIFRASEKATI